MKPVIILFCVILTACGMQGDLYLPDDKDANQAEKTKRGTLFD